MATSLLRHRWRRSTKGAIILNLGGKIQLRDGAIAAIAGARAV
jgi:hypothetical protein